MEWVYGVHPVREALAARRRKLVRLWWRRRARPEVRRLVAEAERLGLAVAPIEESRLAELAGDDARTQGVLLEAGPLPVLELAELVATGADLLVALDGVEDPQNVGSVIRVAEGAGVGGLILTERRAPDLTPALARASAGAVEHLPIARVGNLGSALDELKDKGFWVFGGDHEGGEDLYALSQRVCGGRAVWVFGAEGRGIRPGVGRRLDHRVSIPMAGRVASLNVAAAAAVVLFEFGRRRGLAARVPVV